MKDSEKFDFEGSEADTVDVLDALLHPAQAFAHPSDVVRDPDLTLNEKRAILASWASDACAIEAAPALRRVGSKVIPFDEIIDALRSLDKEVGNHGGRHPHYRQALAKRRGRATGEGQPLN